MNVIRIAQYGRATVYAAVLFPPPASRYSKAMYSAIFTDIDGTLFRSDLTIGDATREAVREAAGKGIRIVLCSGRYITGMARAQEQLGIPVIYSAHDALSLSLADRVIRLAGPPLRFVS